MDIKISIRNFMEKYQNVEYNLNYREGLLKEFLKLVNEIFEEDYKQIKEKGKEKAEEFKNLSYSIFYTNPLQTLKKGDIYYLALNPGGGLKKCDKNDGKNSPYDEENYEYYKKSENEYFCAFDQNWCGDGDVNKNGKHPLQMITKQILNFFIEKLNLDIKYQSIFCTNLYFYRSSEFINLIEKRDFFKFHDLFINIVKPRIIICNSNDERDSAYSAILNSNKFQLLEKQEQVHIFNNFYLKWFFSRRDDWNREKILVIGLPHLSRCDPNTYPEKYIKKIEEILYNSF